MHLNLSPVFNKFEHIITTLNAGLCDVIMLNEVKLDISIPSLLYEHDKYTT